MNVHVLGISVDSVPSLTAWAESLGGITYPLLSDFWPHGETAQRYDILRGDGRSERTVIVVDADGIVRYIDVHDIDSQPDNELLFAELDRLSPTTSTPAKEKPEQTGPPTPWMNPAAGTLVMYCTPWCPDCERARAWLGEQGVGYLEVNVARDRHAKAHAAGLNSGRLHTPTFELDDHICVDFDTERLTALLEVR